MMVTRQFAEMMGAAVDFDSVVGEGSVFWVEMDLLESSNSLEEGETPAESSLQQEANSNRLKVLYIEDSPANMKFMEQVLSRHGNYELLMATTPSRGLELAGRHMPALILLDINLPEMDGYEVLRILKENERTASIPVIAVTASAMTEHITKGMESEFADYITKPVDIPGLLQSMQAATGQ